MMVLKEGGNILFILYLYQSLYRLLYTTWPRYKLFLYEIGFVKEEKGILFIILLMDDIHSFQLFKNSEVMFVEVPKYDEFSASDAWQQVKDKKEINCYFKEYSNKAIPNRGYLYNVRKT